jgi:hypothetical protein
MVKNKPSSSNLRGSTSNLTLRPSQTQSSAATPPLARTEAEAQLASSSYPSSASFSPTEEEGNAALENKTPTPSAKQNLSNLCATTRLIEADVTDLLRDTRHALRECDVATRFKFMASLHAHLEHIARGLGTCDCDPRIRDLGSFEIGEEERIVSMDSLRTEVAEKVKQVKEQYSKDKQARLVDLENAASPAYSPLNNSHSFSGYEDFPKIEKEQTVEAHMGMIRSNVDQEAGRPGFRKHAPKLNEHTPQSTLFSKFDSGLCSEKQTGDAQSYGASKSGYSQSSSSPPSSIGSANPVSTHASADVSKPAANSRLDHSNTINMISADGCVVPYSIVPPCPSPDSWVVPQIASEFFQTTQAQLSLYERYMEESAKSRENKTTIPARVPLPTAGEVLSSPAAQPQFGSQAPKVFHFSHAAGMQDQGKSLLTTGLEREVVRQNVLKSPEAYTQPFCEFLTENPTVWHAVQYFEKKLDSAGFKKVCFPNSILESCLPSPRC